MQYVHVFSSAPLETFALNVKLINIQDIQVFCRTTFKMPNCINDSKWDKNKFVACDLCRPQEGTGRLTFTLSPPSPTHPYTIHMFIVYTSQVKAPVV